MKIKKGYIPVPIEEYSRLCCLDGRVDAVQNFVNERSYASVDEILDILMIDKSKMLKRKEEKKRKYEEEREHAGKD